MSKDGAPTILQQLQAMDRLKASDLFFTEGKVPSARVHGAIRNVNAPATTGTEFDELLDEVLDDERREAFVAAGDLDTGWTSSSGKRYRINLHRQQGVRGLVVRAVPSGDLKFDELCLPTGVEDLANMNRGLVLVSGATGSGKSTTLAAMVHHINKNTRAHIVTIEDPIEFVHQDIKGRLTQREIGTDTHSFSGALREVVRQSPDVIVIGEMRDSETMQVALSAALTGHLVLATLHTINATQTLQRILSYFPDDLRDQVAMDLSLSLRGIVSQRLVPRADEGGRVVAIELLTVGPSASKLIREQRVDELYDLMRSVRGPSMRTFNQSLLALHRDGTINYEVGAAYSSNKDEFALQARGMSTGLASFAQRGDQGDPGELDMKSLLEEALNRGASDLHLTVGRPPILRVDGKLTPIRTAELTEADMRILLYSILSGRQRSNYELDREIDFALALDDGRRFRVNAYFQKGRMAAAMRSIPVDVPDADFLGLPDIVLDLGTRPQGLLLVVGPTGSGKTTTLACLVQEINKTRACRILTVEDPIEYTHEPIRATIDQREVYADTKSFSAALKYVLRQDPDVILIGEMRDLETISSALTAAETGHLVLATLHANDAIQAMDRIIDVFPPHQQSQARAQLSAALLGVVSQRLLPDPDGVGRVAAFEVLVANSAIRNIIREHKLHMARSIMESSKRFGMITMDRALQDLYEAGELAYADAIRYITNPASITPRPGDLQEEQS
ncbi:MAG: PilT/PilU family type 4a pilus ATPase, partial [Myxococcota bacterium]|nr:PilT/PilU family type 4a pilus ATPase [Myxococcota bacterium]